MWLHQTLRRKFAFFVVFHFVPILTSVHISWLIFLLFTDFLVPKMDKNKSREIKFWQQLTWNQHIIKSRSSYPLRPGIYWFSIREYLFPRYSQNCWAPSPLLITKFYASMSSMFQAVFQSLNSRKIEHSSDVFSKQKLLLSPFLVSINKYALNL